MNKEREKIIDWLTDKINKNIVFDNTPDNLDGWYEVKRQSVIKILDGLIPMLKAESKHHNQQEEKK